MSATATQRLVPIRPSPAKGLLNANAKAITIGITTTASPATLTPPRTGIKRKLEESCPENVKCKRKINFGVNYVVSPQPAAVARRNARERNRVKQVNNGFATLRQHIPGASKAKKISKVDTLKQAVDYIRSLQELLDEHDRLMSQGSMNSHLTQIPAVTVNSFDYTSNNISTISNSSLPQSKASYANFYYGENVSPVCTSVYSLTASAHSPACSDGTTSSPSPSYLSDTSSQLSCHEAQPQSILPEETFNPSNFTFADTYGGTFDLYSATTVPNLEEDDVLEAIASWQKRLEKSAESRCSNHSRTRRTFSTNAKAVFRKRKFSLSSLFWRQVLMFWRQALMFLVIITQTFIAVQINLLNSSKTHSFLQYFAP